MNTLRKGYNLLIYVPLIVLGVVHRLKGITAGSWDQRLERGLTSPGFSFLFSSRKLPVTLSLLSLSLWKGFSRVLGRCGLAPQGWVLLLSRFSRVWLCATPQMAAHQAPPSLGFSRQEHWSVLPFPSPMQESEKWKWSHSVVSDS